MTNAPLLNPGPTVNAYQPPHIYARADSLQHGEVYQDERGWRWQIIYRCADRYPGWPWAVNHGPIIRVYIAVKVTGPNRGQRRALTFSDLSKVHICGGPRWYAAQSVPNPALPLTMVPLVRSGGARAS